ncbi:MAG: ComF family protein [Bacteroides sp.]|nr:ComF family protein [Bacteroides sp.]
MKRPDLFAGVRSVLDLIFPPVCHICGAALPPGDKFLCSPCIASLPRTLYHRDPSGTNPMEHRFAGIIPFRRGTGVFFYAPGSPLSQTVQDFKYRKFPGLARRLGQIMANELFPTGFFSGVDAIIPVPIHYTKRLRRGYNQSEMLARGISDVTGIPVSILLKAIKPHRTQTSLSHDARRHNTQGIFSLRHPERLRGKHVMVIDDICTTGATLLSAAEAILKDEPTTEISLISLGVTF